jgi:thiamine monophosphate synthase
LTIVETAAKLGVNALAYTEDRAGGDKKMVSLADRIQATCAEY